jgi:putative sterol carrier protein
MTDATTEFFRELGARGHEPRLEKVKASLRFDLKNGRRTARWLVAIDRGDIAVSRENLDADCVVRADRALFDEIATGETNPVTAVLRGAMEVEGDRELLVLFRRIFPRSGKTPS